MYNFSTVSLSGSYIWINQQKSKSVMIFSDFRTPHTKKFNNNKFIPYFRFFPPFLVYWNLEFICFKTKKIALQLKRYQGNLFHFIFGGKFCMPKSLIFSTIMLCVGHLQDEKILNIHYRIYHYSFDFFMSHF